VRIGIPRGLLYYYYGSAWEAYFSFLGAETVISGETTAAIIGAGSRADEVCLPVKVFCGHADSLRTNVDCLFVPRLVSGSAGYACPKIIGLPDLLRSVFRLPPLITPTIDRRRGCRSLWAAVVDVGRFLGRSPLFSLYAWRQAWRRPAHAVPPLPAAAGDLRIALVGYPYILGDRRLSLDIAGKLTGLGLAVNPVWYCPPAGKNPGLPKAIYWHHCRGLASAALAELAAAEPPAGMIFLSSFACGPDSLIGEILQRRAETAGIPFLSLALDEHSGEAGLVTRLEAFADMLRRRQR
jgi:predicted nucleotide-binding protein (sugar kinase/HSP70/actin superfamily)